MTLEHVIADACWRVVVEQIDGEEADASLAELCGELAQTLLTASDEHERGAGLAREPPGGGFADSAGGAGDEHDSGSAVWINALCHGFLDSFGGGGGVGRVRDALGCPLRRAGTQSATGGGACG